MSRQPVSASALLDVVRLLVTEQPALDIVLVEAARAVTEALAADGCLIYRVEKTGELTMFACHPERATGEQLRLPAGFGITGRVAADAIAVTLVDDNPRNVLHRQLLGLAEGQRVSRLCVPARDPDGSCVAVLAVHSRGHREFLAADVTLSQGAADLLGLRMRLNQSAASVAVLRAEWDGLVAATVAAQEAERRRVAADLHDGVSQAIAGLTFHLSAAEVALSDNDFAYVSDQVRAARRLADLAVGETRSAITGLHSPVLDDLGLAAGLVSMARSIPTVRIDVHAQELELPEHIVISLFRIAQEAVQNIVKHAGVDHAEIHLAQHGRSVVLTVTDSGKGFDSRAELADASGAGSAGTRYGLAGMAERVHLIGGQLQLTSELGLGSTVEVRVPMNEASSSDPAP